MDELLKTMPAYAAAATIVIAILKVLFTYLRARDKSVEEQSKLVISTIKEMARECHEHQLESQAAFTEALAAERHRHVQTENTFALTLQGLDQSQKILISEMRQQTKELVAAISKHHG